MKKNQQQQPPRLGKKINGWMSGERKKVYCNNGQYTMNIEYRLDFPFYCANEPKIHYIDNKTTTTITTMSKWKIQALGKTRKTTFSYNKSPLFT